MKREVDYTWRLAELMAAHGMHNSTDLIPAWPNVAFSSPDPRSTVLSTNGPNVFRCN